MALETALKLVVQQAVTGTSESVNAGFRELRYITRYRSFFGRFSKTSLTYFSSATFMFALVSGKLKPETETGTSSKTAVQVPDSRRKQQSKVKASVDTVKAANGGHLKTGQRK